MKSNVKGLLVALLLPVITLGQTFKSPDFSRQNDLALFAKQIEKHSPLMKQFYAAATIPINLQPGEARALVNQKLEELKNDELKMTYAKLDDAQRAKIGVALYLMMNGYSNTEDVPGLDYKMALGGGLGIYAMWTLANFVLMPELAFWLRPLKAVYNDEDQRERYSYLTLAFTAMYIIRLQAINLLLGLSPNIGYALGGKFKSGDGDWGDIEFGDNGVKRSNFGLGITAGIMLQNAMIIRLMYNMGLSKMYEGSDYKMYALMLALYIPLFGK